MSNSPILTLDSFKKSGNLSSSTKGKAKIEQVKQVISNDQDNKSLVKQNQSINSPPKKLTSEEEKKAKRRAKYVSAWRKFKKLYPKCFLSVPKPLAIGIHNAMREEEDKKPEDKRISKSVIRHFLLVYTGSKAYKKAIIAGGKRIDLQGNEVEIISDKHIEIASKSLKDWNNKQKIIKTDRG